jgi:hypothetical protein
MKTRVIAGGVAAVLVALGVVTPAAALQRRGGRFGYFRPPTNPPYDGAFMFCRMMFDNGTNGDGAGWSVDYPRADENLSYRFSELTSTPVSRDASGNYNHALFRFSDPGIDHCPFIMMTEPGGAFLSDEEAAGLHDYLMRGGFLWADDFWGDYAFEYWMNQLRKALPSGEFPLIDVPMDHQIFHVLYDVKAFPQIPSIGVYMGSGQTSERGAASAVPHARAVTDRQGRILVFMSHNTDFGDAFEREGDAREYFERFAAAGYAVGVNVLLYSLTH